MRELAEQAPLQAHGIARIMQVIAPGQPPVLECEDSGERVVATESVAMVSPLQEGQRVLAQPTRQGWVITAILGGLASPRVQEDEAGRLCLQCDRGIVLQVGDAHIEIDAEGCITVDGKEIHTLASGLQRILGATVQIN